MQEGKDVTTYMTTVQAKTEAFLGHVLSDTSGLTTTIMASIGDRLGTMGMPSQKLEFEGLRF